MQDNSVPRVNSNFTVEKFEDEILLYNEDSTQAVYLNDTAHAVYLLCRENISIAQMIESLEQRYPDQKLQIRPDVIAALTTLLDHGVISINDAE